ncbi:P-loop containing nucleoside triphosphate hydrolase protein [Neohortaea acidophila]|uniref:P-loop containing nucleoside triphosphate hydrolase protein n=1 Tax=Neohortaea acidophila TaxID=245834 RepID=A0A6A6Q2G1_9PEZI|nr:P-loop containing nucleoside triphosphate hydrolase protein [Neohortaea acidophila]KAF2486580.1 P-loop containing nucleoside triphosphate hydrolase protein [Neohortaea acidophila]
MDYLENLGIGVDGLSLPELVIPPESEDEAPAAMRRPIKGRRAVAARMAIDRHREFAQFSLRAQMDMKLGDFRASVIRISTKPPTYWAEFGIEKRRGKVFNQRGSIRAALHTKVIITIIDAPFAGIQLAGTVQEDLFGRGAEMCCHLVFKGKKEVPGLRREMELPVVGVYHIDVELVSDGTACDQQAAAVAELGSGLKRIRGVDLPALFFNTPSTVTEPSALFKEIEDNYEAQSVYRQALERFVLNEQQNEAAKMSLTSPSGALTQWGPAGSGKTTSSLAIILGHMKMGCMGKIKRRPVIACAPSDAAVDSMMRIFLGKINKQDELTVCRFKAAQVRSAPKYPNALSRVVRARAQLAEEVLESGETAEDVLWDVFEASKGVNNEDEDLAPYYFQNARADFIRAIRNDSSHAWSLEARPYLEQKKRLRSRIATAWEQSRLRGELEDQETLWDERFLQKCDIIFCKSSAAAHPTLTDFFRPSILLFDELASATLLDAVTPMASFKESLLHIILAGDNLQDVAPDSIKLHRNEISRDLRMWLNEQLRHGEDFALGEKIAFTTQHRMRDVHARMVSDIWYQGRLIDDPSLAIKSPLAITIEAGLRGLGEFWNGRLRLAVDVEGRPGPDAFESYYHNSRSLCNKAEATLIVDHIQWLLKLDPPGHINDDGPGRRVEPGDIMVISPYSGQVALIRTKLAEKGVNTAHDNAGQTIDVRTSEAAQSTDRNIVLLSWVASREDKPLSIGPTKDSKQMCTNFSRAKEYQVTFGNWLSWMQEDFDDAIAKQASLQTFGKVVRHHREIGDGISHIHMLELHAGDPPKAEDRLYKKICARQPDTGPSPSELQPRELSSLQANFQFLQARSRERQVERNENGRRS